MRGSLPIRTSPELNLTLVKLDEERPAGGGEFYNRYGAPRINGDVSYCLRALLSVSSFLTVGLVLDSAIFIFSF
jgi:hypothetical protein